MLDGGGGEAALELFEELLAELFAELFAELTVELSMELVTERPDGGVGTGERAVLRKGDGGGVAGGACIRPQLPPPPATL
mmetsp:Transcript_42628/g.79019  ORF Transcript_42628/g.79019 Transcript_42628/m.79019 type:complete len:80 (-) Transcript_42628:951-1190(-)